PAAGLVSKVDTRVEQLAHGHNGHGTSFRCPEGHACVAGTSARIRLSVGPEASPLASTRWGTGRTRTLPHRRAPSPQCGAGGANDARGQPAHADCGVKRT